MKFSLKITLSMLCVLSVLFGIGGSLIIALSYNDSLERERQSAYNSYQTVLSTLQIVNNVDEQIDYNDIADVLKQLSNQNTNAWSALRLHTEYDTVYEYGSFDFSLVKLSSASDSCTIQYISDNEKGQALSVSGSLKIGEEIFYLDMICDISFLSELQHTQQRIYQIVFVCLIILCALLSYCISLIITHPLSKLSKATQIICDGDLSYRADINSNDEIGKLANDFNIMVENLENNINQQERFIGSFAHESKTPMTSIIGYADLIRGGTLTEEEQQEAANYIVSEGKRLENLSQKLLKLLVMRNGAITLVPTQPAVVIYGIVQYLTPLYKKSNIALTCECERGICLLEPDLVKSLLVNLLDNAQKALEEKGGYIKIKSTMLSEGCQITVEDNGRGIPSEALEHLTEAFYRVDKSRSREQGGAGLGLALCSEIISLHNGTIKFESEIGKCTKVTVNLKGGII